MNKLSAVRYSCRCARVVAGSRAGVLVRNSSIAASQPEQENTNLAQSTQAIGKKIQEKKKTIAELDEEVRLKLEGRSGQGGEAGLELEGGKPVAMKRGVKENMFRLI